MMTAYCDACGEDIYRYAGVWMHENRRTIGVTPPHTIIPVTDPDPQSTTEGKTQ